MNALTGRKGALRPIAGTLLLMSFLNGCFTYVPVRGDLTRPGTRVKVQLENPQEIRTGQLTANDVVQITGEVVSADTAAVSLSAFMLTTRSGYEHIAAGETTRIPRPNIVMVRENRISIARTAMLAGLSLLAGGLLVSGISNPRGGGDPGGGGGGGVQFR